MISPTTLDRPLVGQSHQTASIREVIEKVSRTRLPVLLLGESGTGKEVVARSIHAAHPQGQFVTIDCGSLVGTLMESELFGHVRGAFSGATENKKGLVDMADGGTAFFDEIGDLPLEMQVKLLRLIQESEFRPVGALQPHKVNIRVIAATHRDLKAEVAAGRFRLDLYYRLNVFTVRLPPLRDRKDDIPILVDHFVDMNYANGVPPIHISPEMLATFQAYDWPGNVRELQHCIDRLGVMNTDGSPQLSDLPSALQYLQSAGSLEQLSQAVQAPDVPERLPSFQFRTPSMVFSIPDSERLTIGNALNATGGERGKAARMLGIGRTTLYRKMKQYGME